jgi:hypothetical protein
VNLLRHEGAQAVGDRHQGCLGVGLTCAAGNDAADVAQEGASHVVGRGAQRAGHGGQEPVHAGVVLSQEIERRVGHQELDEIVEPECPGRRRRQRGTDMVVHQLGNLRRQTAGEGLLRLPWWLADDAEPGVGAHHPPVGNQRQLGRRP